VPPLGDDDLFPRRSFARLGADVVAAALGLNVWVSLILVPGLFVGSFDRHLAFAVFAPVPLAALGVGIARKSPIWLLLTYPATLLIPVAIDPRTASENAQGPVTFALSAVSLVGFLFGSSYLTGAPATRAGEAEERVRRLPATEKVAPRWRRRTRIYVALALLSGIFPAALLYAVNFAGESRAYLHEMFGEDRTPALLALLNLGVLCLWLALYAIGFLGPLAHHRTGDRDLVRDLEQIRRDARQGKPRVIFYFAVLFALGFMGLLIFLRYR
jgi:hypothetical protein